MMMSRKKLIGNTLSLATLSLLATSPSFAGSLFDAFNSVLKSLPINTSDYSQPAPPVSIEERSLEQNDTHPKAEASVQAPIDEQSYYPRSIQEQAPAPNSTSDSSYLFTATLPSSAAVVHLAIAFSDQDTDTQTLWVPVSNGKLSKRVYLSHGPGKYRIRAWYSQNPNRFQSVGEQTYYGQVDVTNTDQRDLRYLLPTGDVQSDDSEIVALARDITAGASSDAEKALKVHDWITHNIAYDADAYFKGTYATQNVDALTTLHDGTSVCNGYANLYAALARASGLRTRVVIGAIIWPTMGQTWEQTGTSQAHAWDEVYVDGRWITLDSTWDSGGIDFRTRTFKRKPSLKYYDLSPEAFSEDHRKLKISSS